MVKIGSDMESESQVVLVPWCHIIALLVKAPYKIRTPFSKHSAVGYTNRDDVSSSQQHRKHTTHLFPSYKTPDSVQVMGIECRNLNPLTKISVLGIGPTASSQTLALIRKSY